MSETTIPQTQDEENSLADAIDNFLSKIDGFIPLAFSMIQLSPKEKITDIFVMLATKAKNFASTSKNTSDNTLLSHLSDGLKAAAAIIDGDE